MNPPSAAAHSRYKIRSSHRSVRSNNIQVYENGASRKPTANHRHSCTITFVSRAPLCTSATAAFVAKPFYRTFQDKEQEKKTGIVNWHVRARLSGNSMACDRTWGIGEDPRLAVASCRLVLRSWSHVSSSGAMVINWAVDWISLSLLSVEYAILELKASS
jgi:hypothetical protein